MMTFPIFLGKCQIHGNHSPPTSINIHDNWIMMIISYKWWSTWWLAIKNDHVQTDLWNDQRVDHTRQKLHQQWLFSDGGSSTLARSYVRCASLEMAGWDKNRWKILEDPFFVPQRLEVEIQWNSITTLPKKHIEEKQVKKWRRNQEKCRIM